MALDNNHDIRTSRISLQKDSIALESVKSEASWQAVVTGNNAVELHPATVQHAPGSDETQTSVGTNLGAEVSRYIPGGGHISASVSGSGNRNLDSANTDFSTISEIKATQPLLKNAWSNAPMDFQINIERNSFNISQEQFKKELRNTLSTVRESYLDLVGAVQAVEIRKAELLYATNALDYERARLFVGEKAEMDTLTAALEYLRASENLMSAEYAVKTAKRNLALAVGLPISEVEVQSGTAIEISPLPTLEEIREQVKDNDDRLAILEITRRNLILQRNRYSNALLPQVDIEAALRNTEYGDNFFTSNNASATRPNTLDPWIGISLTFDLLSRKDRYARKSTDLSLKYNEIEREQLWKELSFSIDAFIDAWAQDSAKLAIRTAEIQIAEKNHNYAIQRYEIGEIDNLAKLKAQSDLINAQLNRLLAEVNLKKLEIAVDQATANVFNRFGVKVK